MVVCSALLPATPWLAPGSSCQNCIHTSTSATAAGMAGNGELALPAASGTSTATTSVDGTKVPPKYGTLTRWWRRKNHSRQIRNENSLKAIYRVLEDREFEGEGVSLQELAELRRETLETARDQVRALVQAGWATTGEDGHVAYLTPEGQRRGWAIVRNHRLWELYLTNLADYEPDHVHDDAEKIEHILGEDAVRELEKLLDYPELDPHGKQIPKVPRKTLPVEQPAGYGGGRPQ